MGLQISYRMGDQISLPCSGWGWRAACKGAVAGNQPYPRDVDPRRGDKPRPCSPAALDPSASVGVSRGAVPQRKEFPKASDGVSVAEEALLGSASVVARLNGHRQTGPTGPFRATNGSEAHSITSSARERSAGEIVRP